MGKRVLGWIRKYLKTSKTAPQRQDGYRSQPPPREFRSIQVPRAGQAQHEEQGESSRGPASQSCLPRGEWTRATRKPPKGGTPHPKEQKKSTISEILKGAHAEHQLSFWFYRGKKNPMIILGHQTFCYTSAWFWWVCVCIYNERIYIYTYSKCITHT